MSETVRMRLTRTDLLKKLFETISPYRKLCPLNLLIGELFITPKRVRTDFIYLSKFFNAYFC